MVVRSLLAMVLAWSTACGPAGSRSDGPVAQLSEAAQPIHALMEWGGGPAPASCDDAAELDGVDPAGDPAAVEAAVVALAGDVLAGFRFDPIEGRLNVETIEREIVGGPDQTDEESLRAGVTAVVVAMGGDEAQVEVELSGTTVVGAPGDPPEMLDKNAQIARRVLGLALGDYCHASFEVTGPLISMNCRWRRVDYDASTLCVDGVVGEEATMAAVAELMAADGFEILPTTIRLEVGSFFWPVEPLDPSTDPWTLRLVGAAAIIDSRGGTIPTREYYLDDGVSLAD